MNKEKTIITLTLISIFLLAGLLTMIQENQELKEEKQELEYKINPPKFMYEWEDHWSVYNAKTGEIIYKINKTTGETEK